MGFLKNRLPGVGALAFRDFRLYWVGYVIEVIGSQMLWVTQGWLLYEISGSPLALGVAGLARAAPATILTFFGGAVADKVDQRRLLIRTQVLQMALLVLLAALSATGQIQIWQILFIVSAAAGVQAFENPARQAMFPHLLQRQYLMDAVSLNAAVHPGARMVGPAIGGILLGLVVNLTSSVYVGASALFSLSALGYAVNVVLLYQVRLRAIVKSGPSTSVAKDMLMGLKFVFNTPIFALLIGMTYFINFFAWSFQSLFPIFAKDVLGVGTEGLGLMYAILGAGSLFGATVAASLKDFHRRGWLIIGGAWFEGIILTLFAFSPWFAISVGLLFFAGLGQSIFNVTAQGTLQYLVPDEFRGRVMGLWGMTHTSVQPLGQLEMGLIASAASAPVAVIIGGVAVVGFALLAALPNRRIRELDLRRAEAELER
jgi:MFS family permease